MLRLIATIIVVAGVTEVAHAQQAGPLPNGPGRDIVASACTQCHTAAPIAQLRMNEWGWRRQVENMILRGAQVAPDDLSVVTSYLADHFGPGIPFPGDAPPAEVHLASGSGAELVEGGCGMCHGIDRVVAARRSPAQWPAIVHRMVDIGAPLEDDQIKQVIAYLNTNYTEPTK